MTQEEMKIAAQMVEGLLIAKYAAPYAPQYASQKGFVRRFVQIIFFPKGTMRYRVLHGIWMALKHLLGRT